MTEVTAHPQALAQCRAWLDANLPGVAQTSVKSNGAAAQAAASNKHLAAIASKRAADYYDMPVVAKNIEDDPNNTTRFLCLGTHRSTPTGVDKTSLICSVPNQPGALHELLDVFAAEEVNMIKLESRPAPHALWHYVFYIDIEGHQEDVAIKRALSRLQTRSGLVKILGSYPKGISL